MDTTDPIQAPPNRFERYDCSDGCPVEAALEQISGKWKGLALYHLAGGPQRFSALKRLLGGVTQRTLTKQLRDLEADGLISRTVHAVIPPRVDYALTEKGQALVPVLMALREWGVAHARATPPQGRAGAG